MSRPRPLQLSPNSPLPDTSSIWARMLKAVYERDWTRPVIGLATLNTLRFAFRAQSSFRDLAIDVSENMDKLASLSLGTAGIYVAATCVEAYGIVTGIVRQQAFARAYLLLSVLVALLVSAISVGNTLSYHTFKDELVLECMSLVMEGAPFQRSTFTKGQWPTSAPDTLSESDVSAQCLAAWSANASAHSLSLIFLDLLPNILVVLFPYAYYRQLTVPTNPRTATTGAASAIPLNAYPEPRYTPLYNSSASIHHSATEERHLPAIPVSAQFSPGPPSFSRSPEGGYSLYDDNEGPEIDKSE